MSGRKRYSSRGTSGTIVRRLRYAIPALCLFSMIALSSFETPSTLKRLSPRGTPAVAVLSRQSGRLGKVVVGQYQRRPRSEARPRTP